MSYWSGRHGGCWWSYFEGEIVRADWDQFLAFSRRSYTEAPAGDVILTIPFRATAPTAIMRREIAEVIDETRATNPIRHHAFATDSTVILAVNTAVNWISKKPYEERTFGDPLAAMRWLAEHQRGLDPAALAREILAKVPLASRWSALSA